MVDSETGLMPLEKLRPFAKNVLDALVFRHHSKAVTETAISNIDGVRTMIREQPIIKAVFMRMGLVINLAPWYRVQGLSPIGSYSRLDFFNPDNGPLKGPLDEDLRGDDDSQGLYYMRAFSEGDKHYAVPHPLTPRLIDTLWAKDLDRSMVRYWANLTPEKFARRLRGAIG